MKPIAIAGLEGIPIEAVKHEDGGWVVKAVGVPFRLHPHRMATRKNAIQAAIEYLAGRDMVEVRTVLTIK